MLHQNNGGMQSAAKRRLGNRHEGTSLVQEPDKGLGTADGLGWAEGLKCAEGLRAEG